MIWLKPDISDARASTKCIYLMSEAKVNKREKQFRRKMKSNFFFEKIDGNTIISTISKNY